ncbi:MAG: LolA family protein [Owenweeksia sp.]
MIIRTILFFIAIGVWSPGISAQDLKSDLSRMSESFKTSTAFNIEMKSQVILQNGQQNVSEGSVYKNGADYYSHFNGITRFTTGDMSVAIDGRNKFILIADYRKEDQEQMQMEMIQIGDTMDFSKYKVSVKELNGIKEYTIHNIPGYKTVSMSFTPDHLLYQMIYYFNDGDESMVSRIVLTYQNYHFDEKVRKKDLKRGDNYLIKGKDFTPLNELKQYRLVDNRKK